MQAKHGRAGKHKRYQRAAVLALTVLLIILLAGRVLPVCAGKNVPAGASLKQAKPGQTLCFPLETAAWRVSDPYGWRKDPFTGEKAFHRGVDLACEEGTPVLAALDGVVTAARRGTAYGNYVRLTHGDGQETLYAHMQYLYVRAGEVVAAGQRLGLLAAFLHEWGHIGIYLALFGQFPVIEVTLTGFCMRTRGREMTLWQTALLAAAGPAVNLVLAGLWMLRLEQRATIRASAFLAANLLTGAFNLLPIPPLDGAQLAACGWWCLQNNDCISRQNRVQ